MNPSPYNKSFQKILTLSLIHLSLYASEVINQPFTIAWHDRSSNEAGFCIEYRSSTINEWQMLDSVATDCESYGPIDLKTNGTYEIRVYAFNEHGHSNVSNILTVDYQKSSLSNCLSWPSFSDVNRYCVYYDTLPFPVPDTAGKKNLLAEDAADQDALQPGIQWIDRLHTDSDRNHYYAITSSDDYSASDSVYYIGVFRYPMSRTDKSGINHLAMPVRKEPAMSAGALQNSIPEARLIGKWQTEAQMYHYYDPLNVSTNFSLSAGDPFIVDVKQDGFWQIQGEIIPTMCRMTTGSGTNFNEIMLPLQVSDITCASRLMADIPNCSSIAYWNVKEQAYHQYAAVIPDSDFPVRPGHAYFVYVSSDVSWPSGGKVLAKENRSIPLFDHVPHTVLIHAENSLNKPFIDIQAFIASRPDEIIRNDMSSVSIAGNIASIQCASFPESWQPGDQLIIQIRNNLMDETVQLAAVLSSGPVDECVESVSFSAIEPHSDRILPNYPNPFNHITRIPYYNAAEGRTRIQIVNVRGETILTLLDDIQSKGAYLTEWDGCNQTGRAVTSGIYYVRYTSQTSYQSQKIILMR